MPNGEMGICEEQGWLLAELLFLLWSYHNYGCSVREKETIEEYTIKEEVVGAYYQSFLYYSGVASMKSQVARRDW
jgi:hypothetical protein